MSDALVAPDALLAPSTWGPQIEEEVTIQEEAEESEEAEALRIAPDPGQPIAKQVAEHRIIHYPYRTWCKFCVMGRGRGAPHGPSSDGNVAIVGIDYFFVTRGGVKKRSEIDYPTTEAGDGEVNIAREAGELVKCIVIRCSQFKAVFAHVVPRKGLDEDDYVADLVVEALSWLGHTSVILKADNEVSLQAVVSRVIVRTTAKCQKLDQIAREEPAKYDSQSNGLTEVGVFLVRGIFRTLKLCVEARIDRYVPIDHALIPWMLEHACLILNTTAVGPDGLTAWARTRGRKFNQRMLGFSEQVLYKLPTKGPLSKPDGNMGTQWREATYLGHSMTSNVYRLGTPEGVHEARSLCRRPESERWDAACLATIKATPWSLREKPETTVTFRDPAEVTGEASEAAAPAGKALAHQSVRPGCPRVH